MTAPRIEVDLAAIEHNARTLVARLAPTGITVTGVTKATLGSPQIARAVLRGGVTRLADSRIENLERLRRGGITAPLTLLRSPAPAQAARAILAADVSLVSDIDVVRSLAEASKAAGLSHGVVLMVELGDLREGLMPGELLTTARQVAALAGVELVGLGANLACLSGVIPGTEQMRDLSALASLVATRLGLPALRVSGGNSANLPWALGRGSVGAVNDLRLGEALLLGLDPLTAQPIDGLRTDAFTVVGAVIESREKPTEPWGQVAPVAARAAHARHSAPSARAGRARRIQTIVALGRQDSDPDGLTPPAGASILGASSDHLVLETSAVVAAGAEMRFGVDYGALLRAMASPFVAVLATEPADVSLAASPSPSAL
ncbi:alanine/ornithine racemase family PLP-dependent enzyme [Demequina muriae]|uniref:Alanine/ornithine racemase family PLP-dependent enzyme n=1 Tax=Demequina muriae TaxID=3051664 RepID=A0ABT8GGU9_9MICO|nr:alanine/ornithine racemase family PLP-dependent enzyme [Demequina sp. EGI L300058]MDN4480659.1 alanine/ornithine racemase family PLP-dependent enzyme [Demequina sp. EGI L300058]